MLSKEQRYSDIATLRNGMKNICYISGTAYGIHPRGGFIIQTRNANQMIEFQIEGMDAMPRWVRDGEPLKIICRVYGKTLPKKDPEDAKEEAARVVVLRAIRFEVPSVLDMPPEEAWERSVPKGAPKVEVEGPKNGQHGLPHTKASSIIEVAGFVSGRYLRKATAPGPNGKPGNACLHVLIQQTKAADEAILVKIYGKLSPAIVQKIKLGSPVLVKDGEYRVDVKETGEVGEDGVAIVTKRPFVKATGLHIATRDHIQSQPDWAKELALSGRQAAREAVGDEQPHEAAVSTERPALQIGGVTSEDGLAATSTRAVAAPNGEDELTEEEKALVAASARKGARGNGSVSAT